MDGSPTPYSRRAKRSVLLDSFGVGAATGLYGLSFGALATTSGLSIGEACALSLLMFTGASQFALVGVVASGGNPLAGAATATLLGLRNALYGVRLNTLLSYRWPRRVLAAHLVIDESTAMAVAQDHPEDSRLAFWATGTTIFVLWNLCTAAGAAGAQAFADPVALGLDAAAPAAFLALLAPRLRGGRSRIVALAAVVVALAGQTVLAAGLPILLAGAVTTALAWPSEPAQP